MKANVNYAGRTSMEVGVKVFGEHPLTGQRRHTSTAYLTFVAPDEDRQPTEIPAIIPETEEEKRRYAEAEERRALRLQMRAAREGVEQELQKVSTPLEMEQPRAAGAAYTTLMCAYKFL